MPLNLTGKSGTPELVGARRVERHRHASRRARFAPDDEHARLSLLHLAAGLSDELGATLEQHDAAVSTEGIRGRDTGRHPRQRRVNRGLQGAIDEGPLGQKKMRIGQQSCSGRGARSRLQERRQRVPRARALRAVVCAGGDAAARTPGAAASGAAPATAGSRVNTRPDRRRSRATCAGVCVGAAFGAGPTGGGDAGSGACSADAGSGTSDSGAAAGAPYVRAAGATGSMAPSAGSGISVWARLVAPACAACRARVCRVSACA